MKQTTPKKRIRFFNTTGPCYPDYHYMLPPEERLQGAQLHRFVRDNLYWVLHAPRQTGKTTFLRSWANELNAAGECAACYVSVKDARAFVNASEAIPVICTGIREYARGAKLPVPKMPQGEPQTWLRLILAEWARLVVPKPLVVLFDEVDSLTSETLLTFLGVLRGGFPGRGIGEFPTSIALVGMRDLRDYIIKLKNGGEPNPGSPFNIKEKSSFISNFTKKDIARLFAQRTDETGQQITDEALDYVWEQTFGQPWLVNSFFKRATIEILDEESTDTVTLEHMRTARKTLLTDRETHLDALKSRLSEPRVKRIIQAILTGDTGDFGREDDDVQYAMDLGLVRWSPEENFTISNPLYAEVLTRKLNSRFHDNLPPASEFRWQRKDGSLDMNSLLREFQKFWRENEDVLEEHTSYTEAFPHLLLLAFLQRITNGEGRIEREYATGRKRMDLAIEYRGEWNIIEIKLLRDRQTLAKVRSDGLKQVLAYSERFSLPKTHPPCYLVIFDRRSAKKRPSWKKRLFWEKLPKVTVVGC
jgi:hypothetical protein